MRPHGYVETFLVDRVKEQALPETIQGFEAMQPVLQEVLRNCPVVLRMDSENGQQGQLPFTEVNPYDQTPPLVEIRRAGPEHGRSFIVDAPGFTDTWHDEFDNVYRSVTLKGNNFSHTQLIPSATASERFIAYGLQESAIIERVLKASHVLRSNGIATEYILGLAEPQHFLLNDQGIPIQSEPVPLASYKHYLTEKHWRSLSPEEQSAETYVETARKQERSTYYISARAMDSSHRIKEVVLLETARQAVYDTINSELLADNEIPYDPNKSEDLYRYTDNILVPALSTNLAKLHSLGLRHTYPNSMNVTAFGGLIDLDSVRGEALDLGDEPSTAEDYAVDLLETTAIFASMMGLAFDANTHLNMNQRGNNLISQYFDKVFPDSDEITRTKRLLDIVEAARRLVKKKDQEDRWAHYGGLMVVWMEMEIGRRVLDSPEVIPLTQNWLASEEDDMKRQLAEHMPGLIEENIDLLVEDCLREMPKEFADGTCDPFNVLMGRGEKICESAMFMHLASGVENLQVRKTFKQFFADNFERFTSKPELAGDLSADQIALLANCIFDNESVYDSIKNWSAETVYALFDDHAELVRKLCQPKEYLSVVPPEYPVSVEFLSGKDKAVSGVSNVPLAEVFKVISQPDADFTVEMVPRIQTDLPWDIEMYETSSDAELIQVVSDTTELRLFPEYANDGSLRIEAVGYLAEDGDYTMFVERKQDGQYRYRLILEPKDGDSKVFRAAPERKLQMLEELYLSQQELPF